jgi:exopolyphosphatase/guanosine-5'-triphosphate,3'-diphosphate pyrophosphatase
MVIQQSAHTPSPESAEMVAIIDIGSNSVRMVIYHAMARVPLPLFNEKYMCALGRGIAQTGLLSAPGKEQADAAIGRFVHMAHAMGVHHIHILGTAAMRDAEDGQAFASHLHQRHGVPIQIISGAEEARYAALGIVASIHEPRGICADLGGGSMELAQLTPSEIGQLESLPLGGLRLAETSHNDPARLRAMIAEGLAKVTWLHANNAGTLYAIGGGFRAIAKMHMRESGYPLPILHEYSLSRARVRNITGMLCQKSVEELAMTPGIPRKRAGTMRATAMMLDMLMEHCGAKRVMFSVSGIREGYYYDMLSSQRQRDDTLIASANDLASLVGSDPAYAPELLDWMAPLFANEPPQWQRLRRAVCILSELSWRIDQNFRADWAYQRIIQSSLKGIDHKERVMLALAMFHRYQSRWKQRDARALRLLDERARIWARAVGLSANLAYQLSGARAGNLMHAPICMEAQRPVLALADSAKPLRTEIVEKRLEGLGETLSAFNNFVL